MQIILPLLAIFSVLCILYGIFSGVGWVMRIPKNLRSIASKSEEILDSRPSPSKGLQLLKELHSLYEAGVLSEDEFVKLKNCIISTVTLGPGNIYKDMQ